MDDKKMECKGCGVTFKDKEEMDMHMKEKHAENMKKDM